MTDELVDDVRLRRVERRAVMAHVLRREEHPATEVREERPWRHETGHGVHTHAGARCGETVVHLRELRHPLGRQSDQTLALARFDARIPLVQDRKLTADGPPDLVFLGGVVDRRDRLPLAVVEGEPGDGVAAGAIAGIAKTGVIAIELHEPFGPACEGGGGRLGSHVRATQRERDDVGSCSTILNCTRRLRARIAAVTFGTSGRSWP